MTTIDGPTAGDILRARVQYIPDMTTFIYDFRVPEGRSVDVFQDRSDCRPSARLGATTSFIFSCGFLMSFVLAVVGREASVANVLATMFLLSATVRVVAAGGFWLCFDQLQAVRAWLFVVPVSLMHCSLTQTAGHSLGY
jgi:hypothetical protein